MKFLDWTFETPEENLACEEALLDLCEEGRGPEILRFWKPRDYFAVAGYSNKIQTEIRVEACEKKGVPILRRASGGGTVLQGPGCLNYSLILKIDRHPEFKTITSATRFIMETHAEALTVILRPKADPARGLLRRESINRSFPPKADPPEFWRALHPLRMTKEMTSEIQVQGTSDLTLGNLKFSGNAQRRKQKAFLFHGTFLLNFDLPVIEELLALPSRRPAYRNDRSHSQFLTNLKLPPEDIQEALIKAWGAGEKFQPADIPLKKIHSLVNEKYSRHEWNFKF